MSQAQATSLVREPTRVQDSTDVASDIRSLPPSNYSVRVATTCEQIRALRRWWKRWSGSLDSDIDYFLYSLAHDPSIVRPYVLTVFNHGIVEAMLVGEVKWSRAFAIVSSLRIPGPKAKVLEIKQGGRIGQPSPVIDRVLALELLKVIESREVDYICFDRLPLHSEIYLQIQQSSRFLVKTRVPHIFSYSVLRLKSPKTKGSRIFPGKVYRENRRRAGVLNDAFPGQVHLKCFSGSDEFDLGMQDAMCVAVTTWQYQLGLSLSDTMQTRERFRFVAERGWLRIYVLYIGDTPCAFLIGQVYGNTFYCEYAGYHPDFARFAVGSLLTARVFEELAVVDVHQVDFGEGDQEHYRQLGCQMSEEGTVHVYGPTMRGLLSNAFFGITQIVRRGGRRTQSILQLDRLSKVWRKYLISRRRSRATQWKAAVDQNEGKNYV